MPSWRSRRIDTRLSECASASRSRVGPLKLPCEFFGRQAVSMPLPSIHDRRVRQHRGGGEAVLQRRGVQERLEARAGLAFRLHRAVVLVVEVVEAADQRRDRAIVGIQGHQRALRLGQLHQLRGMPLPSVYDVHDIPARQHLGGALGRRATCARNASCLRAQDRPSQSICCEAHVLGVDLRATDRRHRHHSAGSGVPMARILIEQVFQIRGLRARGQVTCAVGPRQP